MCDLFIISSGFSWERSDLFLPPKWNVALATTGLGRYLFFFERFQKTYCSSGLTASQISRLAWPGALGVLRMVVFMEPHCFAVQTQPGPGSAERNPTHCPDPRNLFTCGVAEVTNTLAIRPFLLYIVSRPQGASGQPLSVT